MLRFRNGIPHGSDGTHRENILHSQLTDKANQTKSCMCLYVRMYIYNVCHWVRSVLFMLALSMRIIQNDALNKFERILGNFLRIWELNNFKRIMCLSLLGCVGDL